MMIKKLQVLSMLSALNFAVIDRQKNNSHLGGHQNCIRYRGSDSKETVALHQWRVLQDNLVHSHHRVPLAEILSISPLTGRTAK